MSAAKSTAVLGEISGLAMLVSELVMAHQCGHDNVVDLLESARNLARQIGFMADTEAKARGGSGFLNDPAEWLLSPTALDELAKLGRARADA
jgi:hypothetical protein